MGNKIVEVRNLVITFNRGKELFKAVNDVSFDINKGEIIGLVGESGSGKTTIGWSILGLHNIEMGDVKYFGQEITKNPNKIAQKERKFIASSAQMIFQNPDSSLNYLKTVENIIAEGIKNFNFFDNEDKMKEILNERIDLLNNNSIFLEKFVKKLSKNSISDIDYLKFAKLHPENCSEVSSLVNEIEIYKDVHSFKNILKIQKKQKISDLYINDVKILNFKHLIKILEHNFSNKISFFNKSEEEKLLKKLKYEIKKVIKWLPDEFYDPKKNEEKISTIEKEKELLLFLEESINIDEIINFWDKRVKTIRKFIENNGNQKDELGLNDSILKINRLKEIIDYTSVDVDEIKEQMKTKLIEFLDEEKNTINVFINCAKLALNDLSKAKTNLVFKFLTDAEINKRIKLEISYNEDYLKVIKKMKVDLINLFGSSENEEKDLIKNIIAILNLIKKIKNNLIIEEFELKSKILKKLIKNFPKSNLENIEKYEQKIKDKTNEILKNFDNEKIIPIIKKQIIENTQMKDNIKNEIDEMNKALKNYKKSEWIRNRVVQVLDEVGLNEDALNKHPDAFSGGQKQRKINNNDAKFNNCRWSN